MANESYENFLSKGSNFTGGEPEFYEDTHDVYGNYIGSRRTADPFSAPQQNFSGFASQKQYAPPPQPQYAPPLQQQYARPAEAVYRTEQALGQKPQFKYSTMQTDGKKSKAAPLPGTDEFVFPRMYQNIVLYAPRTSGDVERLIDYMLRREPAVVDLDPIADSPDAQRILDFVSGAVYALGGRIIGIKTNMFLIVPEGIEVARPEGY